MKESYKTLLTLLVKNINSINTYEDMKAILQQVTCVLDEETLKNGRRNNALALEKQGRR